MKICIISKYPPIQGGVSSAAYWLAKGLGEEGDKVFVISNCWEAEPEYRELMKNEDMELLEPKNVQLFSTTNEFRSPILKSRYFTSRIASIAIDAIRKYDIDLIYSHYLLPYGISAMIAKQATGKPLVVQHAGSDITRLFSYPSLKSIFLEVFSNADRIIAYSKTKTHLGESMEYARKFVNPGFGIDLKAFNPDAEKLDLSEYTNKEYNNKTIFSYFGKISGMKKTNEFIDALSVIRDENFLALFVIGNNPMVENLKKKIVLAGLEEKCVFLPFLPPWKIPKVMNLSTCVVCPESEETPYLPKGTHGPKIAREAMACGKCAIIGKGVHEKGYYQITKDSENIIVVDPEKKHEFAGKLKWVIDNPREVLRIGKNAREFAMKNENFEAYINNMHKIFFSLKENPNQI